MHVPLATAARRRRSVASLLAATLSTLVALTMVPTAPANAAEGPAPSPRSLSLISDVHTDAISTFWDDEQLVLATKADTPELHTRYEADEVWFHLDNDSRVVNFPSGYDFVAPAGATVWMAPESQQANQIWPGFSTESVPLGTLDDNDTTLSLVDVDGPGDVELWQTGTFGAVQRLWSSDEDIKSFTRKNVHMHANWAFTEAGAYRLTVRADAAVDGTPVSDTAVYTFVVGDLPEDVETTTDLAASATSLTFGDPITLTAEVSPAEVAGYVEFRDGGTVLGHSRVDEGQAELDVPDLPVGNRTITAVFVPEVENHADTSTSETVNVTVIDASGEEFAVTGIANSYLPGDILQARVAGVTLEEAQEIEWRARPVGSGLPGTVLSRFVVETNTPEARAGRLSLRMDASYDGYELQAALMEGGSQIATTAWAGPITVPDAVDPLTLDYDGPIPFRLGDTASLKAVGRELADGETLRVALNGFLSNYSLWTPATNGIRLIDDRTFAFEPANNGIYPLALQVVRDGLVVAQSDLIEIDHVPYEFLLEGMQPVYRAGQTFSATITVAPDLGDDVTYSWAMYDDYENPMKIAQGAAGRTFEMPVTADMDGKRMFIAATVSYASGSTAQIGGAYPYLTVTDADPSTQLFLFSNLADHYHQGAPVNLELVADPTLVEGDAISWEWRWPGAEWASLPDASGLSHSLTAEQALDGVEVRATLDFGDSDETLGAEPVTIHVDDHGAVARQQPTVAGATSYAEGDTVTLARELPDNGATILTDHQWERKAAGAEEWTVVEGAAGAELSFAATLADEGAQYRVSILKPNGDVAYGPSPAVELHIAEGSGETTVDIADFPDEFVHGEAYTLTAAHTGTIEDPSYRWEYQLAGSSTWNTVNDANGPVTGPELNFTANRDWDGWRWRVSVLNAGGEQVSQSQAHEMRVVLPSPTEDGLHILGLSGHYHSGNAINLEAVLVPADDEMATYRWSMRRADQNGFHVVDGQSGSTFTGTAEQALDGAEIKVERIVAGEVVATSESVTVIVDDHGAPAPQVVSISGPTQYDEGDSATLTATVAPGTVLDRYQWYVTPAGSDTAEPVEGETSATYAFTAGPEHDGAALTVAVMGEDGTVVYGPSQSHVLEVVSGPTDPEPVATTVSAAWLKQEFGRTAELRVKVAPKANGMITVDLPATARQLSGTVVDGEASITLPARILKPGRRILSISYAGIAGSFEPSSATSAVRVVKADPKVKITPGKSVVERGEPAAFKVMVSATGVQPSGTVTIEVADKRRSVQLNKHGAAFVKVAIPRGARPGPTAVKAAYSGDRYVETGTSVTWIRVLR